MARIHNNAVTKEAKKEYKVYVTSVEKLTIGIFLTDDEIKMKHSYAQKKAFDYLKKHLTGDEESNSDIFNELSNVCMIPVVYILHRYG